MSSNISNLMGPAPEKFYVRGDKIISRKSEELEKLYKSTFGDGPDSLPDNFEKFSAYEDSTKLGYDNRAYPKEKI